jgi:hypothetical protein
MIVSGALAPTGPLGRRDAEPARKDGSGAASAAVGGLRVMVVGRHDMTYDGFPLDRVPRRVVLPTDDE